mgnify:CR=1 FL=1
MAQWGRNDQSVTANSTTTIETSNGAPIGTYVYVKGGSDRVNGANAHFGNTSPGSRANVDVRMFNNTTPSAFLSGAAVGVFGADSNEITVNRNAGIAHAGWQIRRAGTGGRAGRVQWETLVALAEVKGDGTDDIIYGRHECAWGLLENIKEWENENE